MYLWPTHAGVKIINNSQQPITEFTMWKVYYEDLPTTPLPAQENILLKPLNPNETYWRRIEDVGSFTNHRFYYKFDFNGVTVGDSLFLRKDDQFKYEVE
jgi:hypothetical protein